VYRRQGGGAHRPTSPHGSNRASRLEGNQEYRDIAREFGAASRLL